MKRALLFFLVSITVVLFLGCNRKAKVTDTERASTESIPIPESNNSVKWECGTYYSDISEEKLHTYLEKLSEDGWSEVYDKEFNTEVRKGTTEYTLIRGEQLLQIMIFFHDPSASISNSILVKVDENISKDDILQRKDALSKEEASDIIRTELETVVEQGDIPASRQNFSGLFELFIEDAYERLQVQAFAATGENGFAGCFLVRKGVASYVKGDLQNACIIDIDGDKKYEVVDLVTQWSDGIYIIHLLSYEYRNPEYFSSLTEILIPQYSNCFVSQDFHSLQLQRTDKDVKLIDDERDYGKIIMKDNMLFPEKLDEFPYDQWSLAYDQENLLNIEKEDPSEPPELFISVDGVGIDYVVRKTKWKDISEAYSMSEELAKLTEKADFIPTFTLGGFGGGIEESRLVTLDFGNSIPDTIVVKDAMLDERGAVRYGDKLILDQSVKILDQSRVQFNLTQHFAYGLSSNSADYQKDWQRLFWVICTWGEKECVYTFLINTGMEEKPAKITDPELLVCEGEYSPLSSTWGLGILLNAQELPEDCLVEWNISDGSIVSWSQSEGRPLTIQEEHHGYPMTRLNDDNKGAIIWNSVPEGLESKNPNSDQQKLITIEAIIYKDKQDHSPIAYSKIVLEENDYGAYKRVDLQSD